MRWIHVAFAFGTAALAVASLASAQPLESTSPEPLAADAGPTACVKWHGEARSNGYGYKHVVVIDNGCKKPATCAVSTDVNPTVQNVTVAPQSTEEVVTFFDSPVSAFVPNVTCKL
jgi:hypothetical protein